MMPPLLQTKLRPPPLPPKRVERPRLHRHLSGGLRGKLTLVAAPAGFGKTTLIAEWLQTLDARAYATAWLGLDEDDNDGGRFLRYIVAALQEIDPHIGTLTESLVTQSNPQPTPQNQLVATLLNEISHALGEQTLVLVMDDFHLIDSAEILQGLDYLLQYQPPQVHLVLITRNDPPLALARLRARRQLTELRAPDLRFTLTEATHFLNHITGLNLAPADITALETRTEGWIAGLQLAALSMQGRTDKAAFIAAFTGSHRYVVDYLMEEVLNQRTPAQQSFLQQTSILDRLTGPLCDAILQSEPGTSHALLNELEQANLFLLPLDNERRWYRYHPLLAEVLRANLQQSQPDRVPLLHRRAGIWFEQAGLLTEAINHALKAADYQRAADLVEQEVERLLMSMLSRYETSTLLTMLNSLPEAMLTQRPLLSLAHAWAILLSTEGEDDVRRAQLRLEQAESQLGPAPRRDHLAHIAVIRTFIALARQNMAETLRLGEAAKQQLPADNVFMHGGLSIMLGNAYYGEGNLAAAKAAFADVLRYGELAQQAFLRQEGQRRLAEICLDSGHLREAEAHFQEMLRHVSAEVPVLGSVHINRADIFRQRHELETAAETVRQGIDLTLRHRWESTAVIGHVVLARIRWAQGDPAAVFAVLDAGAGLPNEVDEIRLWLEAIRARFQVLSGQLDAAIAWAETCGLHLHDGRSRLQLWGQYTTLLRIAMARQQWDEAEAWLQQLSAAVAGRGLRRQEAGLSLLRARLRWGQGDRPAARAATAAALDIAEPEGMLRLFADEGPAMLPLLRLVNTPFSRRLQPLIDSPGNKVPPPSEAAALPEPLSERELEVLRLMAQGYSNRDIAAELIVAVGTVKKHAHNIFGKLGVNSRTQAILKANRLHLVDPPTRTS